MIRRLTAQLAAVLLAAVTPLAVVAVPASAAGACTFTPLGLTANQINDPWPDSADEIRFDYGSKAFRANNVHKGTKITGMPSEAFGTELHVEVWELDTGHWPNDNDFLGSYDIGGYNQTNGQRHFLGGGADYFLTFNVTCG